MGRLPEAILRASPILLEVIFWLILPILAPILFHLTTLPKCCQALNEIVKRKTIRLERFLLTNKIDYGKEHNKENEYESKADEKIAL